MILNVEDVEVVEVGRMYMVPTVIWKRAPKALRIIPVIGPLHEDADYIGFPDRHWHPDRRFVTKAWMEFYGPQHWGMVYTPFPSPRVLRCLSKLHRTVTTTETSKDPQVVDGGQRRLLCRREVESFNDYGDKPPAWLRHLEPAYFGERLRDGHICPHRGISCRGVVAENDGVVCPGHGLKWNLETGRLVSRIGHTFQAKLF